VSTAASIVVFSVKDSGNNVSQTTVTVNFTLFTNAIQYLGVGGGGGGGAMGAGGAGGVAVGTVAVSACNSINVTVGTGGCGATATLSPGYGTRGGDTVISGTGFSTVTALGGGGGGFNGCASIPSMSGGSGGGSGGLTPGSGGSSLQSSQNSGIPGITNLGNPGGTGSNQYVGGGGGGGGSAGPTSGTGGSGYTWSYTGNTYAGGGGGGGVAATPALPTGNPSSSGGSGGGGTGIPGAGCLTITRGTDGLGGGGGGGGFSTNNPPSRGGGVGGSGTAIFAYSATSQLFFGGTVTPGASNPAAPGYYVHRFTSPGTFTYRGPLATLVATGSGVTANSTIVNLPVNFYPFGSVTGGYSPYTYYITAGTLPTGITLNTSNGLVSGTPITVQGPSSVTFAVKDLNNTTTSTTVSVSFTVLTIPATASATTSQSLTSGTAMTSFNPLTATGGFTPYTYYISTGTLPTGITLDSSTGLVSGTPTIAQVAGSVTFAVKDAQNNQATTTTTVSFAVVPLAYTAYYVAVGGGTGGQGGCRAPYPPGVPGAVTTGSTAFVKGVTYSVSVGPSGSYGQPSGYFCRNGSPAGGTSLSGPGGSIVSAGVGGGGSSIIWPYTGQTYGGGLYGSGGQGGVSPSGFCGAGSGGQAGVLVIAVPSAGYSGSSTGASISNPAVAPGFTVLGFGGPGTYRA
jgi:hypothetical protein